ISCNYCHAKLSGGATRIRDHMCRCAAAPNAVKVLFGTRNVDAKEKATAAKAKRTLNFNTDTIAETIRLARKLPPHTRYSPPTRKTLAGPMLIRWTDGYKDINGHHISNYLLVCALGAYFHSSVNSTVGPDTTVRVDAIYTAQQMHRVVQA
ncbi:hypothetical protein QJQ45_022541, partial [Haematococcus lacustris]